MNIVLEPFDVVCFMSMQRKKRNIPGLIEKKKVPSFGEIRSTDSVELRSHGNVSESGFLDLRRGNCVRIYEDNTLEYRSIGRGLLCKCFVCICAQAMRLRRSFS